MIAKKYPEQAHIEEFLRLAGDESTGTMYVHCAGGRHRTGVMGAVYRFNNYGWDYEKVYKEMKDYDFYTRWGHGAFKDFVEDYWSQKSSESKK
jgi:protein tyrosine/serine phosphatase